MDESGKGMNPPEDPEETMNHPSDPAAALAADSEVTKAIAPGTGVPGDSTIDPFPEPLLGDSSAYALRRKVASGGCGEVWEANQLALDRIVAVKVLRASVRGDSAMETAARAHMQHQFRIEATTTARLEHPNIVPVYDLGNDARGWPLMAMKLVKGESWTSILDRDFKTMEVDEYLAKHLDILISVMQAVAFAHARCIIHRDIKPSQVMLGEFGEVHLMDWGLAMSAIGPESDDAQCVRISGLPFGATAISPAGTPAYMAPEQVAETAERVTYATDVYLLGGTLYKILTGQSPRGEADSTLCMVRALEGVVTPIEEAAGDRPIPAELVALANRALEPEPDDRIPSVPQFIADIRSYLSGATDRSEAEKMIASVKQRMERLQDEQKDSPDHEAGALYAVCSDCLADLERARALSPRNPSIGTLRAAVLEIYSGVALRGGDLMLARGLAGLTDNPERKRVILGEIERQEAALERHRRQRTMLTGLLALLAAIIVGGAFLFIRNEREAAARIAVERDIAQEATATAVELRERAEIEQYFANIETAQVSLERSLVEKASGHLFDRTPPNLRRWEWGHLAYNANRHLFRLSGYDQLNRAIFTFDGERILSMSREGRLTEWDATTGRRLGERRYFDGRLSSITPSPDGSMLLLTSFDRVASIVDAASGEVLHRLEGHTGALQNGAWSPDGRTVATTSTDSTVRLWDVQRGATIRVMRGFESGSNAALFLAEGRSIAIVGGDAIAGVWSVRSGELQFPLRGHSGNVPDIRLSPDGSMLATAGSDGFVRFFDAQTGVLFHSFLNSQAPPSSVAFVRDGEVIATTTDEGLVQLYDRESGRLLARALVAGPSYLVTTSPDGEKLLVSSRSEARVFSLAELLDRPVALEETPGGDRFARPDDLIPVFGLPSGRDPSWRQRERIWNTEEGRTFFEINGRLVAVESRYSTFSPDGAYRFDIDPETLFGAVRDVESGRTVYTHPRVRLLKGFFSPNGRTLAILDPLDRVHLIDTETWQERHVLRRDPQSRITVALDLYIASTGAFSPDSRRLVIPYLNGRITAWNVETGELDFETEPLHGAGIGVAFDRRGERFVLAGLDHTLTMWDARSGEQLARFVGHTAHVFGAAFDPSGDRVVSFARDRTVRLWEAASGREIVKLYAPQGSETVVGARFTGDGRSVLIVLDDGNVEHLRAVPWDPGEYAEPSADVPFAHRFELRNRRNRIDNSITLRDVMGDEAEGAALAVSQADDRSTR